MSGSGSAATCRPLVCFVGMTFHANKFTLKKIILLAALAAASSLAFALPGFVPFISDASGEYVYYRDHSFPRESYVGFLAYDEATYAARYYAPRDVAAGRVEESVLIYFSLDPKQDHISFTGEKIGSAITPEQTDIVNYLHDLVYEFSARRIRAGEVNPKTANVFSGKPFRDRGLSVAQDFPQFGGQVHIVFDYLVPLFNVKKIVSNDNKVLLEVATTGILVSSADTAFVDFAGFPPVVPNSKAAWRAEKNTKKQTHALADGQAVTLDEAWAEAASASWLLGESAFLFMRSFSTQASTAGAETDGHILAILRRVLASSQGSFSDWKDLSLEKKGQVYALSAISMQRDTGRFVRVFYRVAEKKSGAAALLLSVDNAVYETNRAYFDAILKSYKPE